MGQGKGMGGGGEGSSRVREQLSLPLRASWKVTFDVDAIAVHASKSRSGSAKNHYTIRGKAGKKFCSMTDNSNCKNNWRWLSAFQLFNLQFQESTLWKNCVKGKDIKEKEKDVKEKKH